MINQDEGAVIFQQRSGNSFDGFADGLMPYLSRAERQIPRNFIFLEPRHRTEQRLQSIRAYGSGFSLCPISTGHDRRTPSLWRTCGDGSLPIPDSGLSFDLSPGLAVVSLAEIPLVVFAAGPRELARVSREVWVKARWCVVCCRDTSELAALPPAAENPQMILLPTQTAESYPPSTRVVSQLAIAPQLIVAEGESVRLTDSSGPGAGGH